MYRQRRGTRRSWGWEGEGLIKGNLLSCRREWRKHVDRCKAVEVNDGWWEWNWLLIQHSWLTSNCLNQGGIKERHIKIKIKRREGIQTALIKRSSHERSSVDILSNRVASRSTRRETREKTYRIEWKALWVLLICRMERWFWIRIGKIFPTGSMFKHCIRAVRRSANVSLLWSRSVSSSHSTWAHAAPELEYLSTWRDECESQWQCRMEWSVDEFPGRCSVEWPCVGRSVPLSAREYVERRRNAGVCGTQRADAMGRSDTPVLRPPSVRSASSRSGDHRSTSERCHRYETSFRRKVSIKFSSVEDRADYAKKRPAFQLNFGRLLRSWWDNLHKGSLSWSVVINPIRIRGQQNCRRSTNLIHRVSIFSPSRATSTRNSSMKWSVDGSRERQARRIVWTRTCDRRSGKMRPMRESVVMSVR